MRHFLTPVIALLLALMPFSANAGSIALILSESGGPYAEFTSTLSSALAGSNWQIATTLNADNAPAPLPKTDLIVTAGAISFRQALNTYGATQPILATLLPRQSYDKLLAEAGIKGNPRTVSAIWLDQPLSRQAAFLRQLLPNAKRVGLLGSNETNAHLAAIRQAITMAGLQLDTEDVEANERLLTGLNQLLPRIDVLLALPDNQIYRRENIKPILMSSYRHRKPVVAFSKAFVSAGALAALYTTPAQLGRQTADILLASSSGLPPASYPTQFAVAINHDVAHALGLNIPDEATVRQNMFSTKESR